MNDQIRDAYERELANNEIKRLKAELASMTRARDEGQAVADVHRAQITVLESSQRENAACMRQVKQDLKPRAIAALCALRLGPRTKSSVCYAIGDQRGESTADLLVDLTSSGLVGYRCNDWFLTSEGVGWCESNGVLVDGAARCWAQVHSERAAKENANG